MFFLNFANDSTCIINLNSSLMKKVLLLLAVFTASLTASAGSLKPVGGAGFKGVPHKADATLPLLAKDLGRNQISPFNRAKLAANQSRKAPRKAASVNDLVGSYVITLEEYAYDVDQWMFECYDVTLSALGTDSVIISGLSYYGDIHAKVDLQFGGLEIPSQVVYNYDSYGDLSIAVVDTTSSNWGPDRSVNIYGTIYDDGSIEITDYWSLWIDSGQFKDYYIDRWYYTLLEVPNGTYSATRYISQNNYSINNNVVIRQTNDSTVTIQNFDNMYIELYLDKDSAVSVPRQDVYYGGSTQGMFYMIGYDYYENDSTLSENPDSITPGSGKGSNKSISLDWFTFRSANNYWFGVFYNNLITYTSDDVFTYPANPSGIRSVNVADRKNAVRKEYYNAAGARSSVPQKGLNIVVTRYADGSTDVKKVIER